MFLFMIETWSLSTISRGSIEVVVLEREIYIYLIDCRMYTVVVNISGLQKKEDASFK